MKVDLTGSTPDPIITQQQDQRAAQHASLTPDSAGEDEATLSLGHDSIGTLTAQAMATSSTRQDRIDALRQAISSGQYKIAPDTIAVAILSGSIRAFSA